MKVGLSKRESGFSLLEMVVATALGSIVLAAAAQMYIQGVSATWTVSQRAEMQQDFRAASNILTKDLSLAGAGLGNGASVALPATGTLPVFGCDQAHCYINGTSGVTYPTLSGTPYLYGLLPGLNKGPTVNSQTTDSVTVVYTDTSFYLNCYTATATATGVVTFAPPASPTTWLNEGCLPATGWTVPQDVNDSAVGLTIGDLVLMNLGSNTVIAEVTGPVTATGAAKTFTVPFANSDALHMNHTASPNYLNTAGPSDTGTSPMRLLVVTYYIDNTTTPPRLMRQISGHTPMPVAENVVYLKFSYDLYDDTSNTAQPDQADGGAGLTPALLPNQITKINIKHMAMNSTLKGTLFGPSKGYQSLDLQTSVSARNLTYTNNYPQ